MDELWLYGLWAVVAYLLGSVSMGALVARRAGVNIRKLGTRNPGAANIWREIGPRYGAATLLLDIAKGAAVTVPPLLLDWPGWVGLAAMMSLLAGQFFPVFSKFRGNTGMAACMGATAGLLPLGALIGTPITLVAIRLSRNTGWSGLLFFVIVLLAGGLLHRDVMGVIAVSSGGVAVFLRGLAQYRGL